MLSRGGIKIESVACPYCEKQNHTSNPRIMAACAYCGNRFAQANTDYQELVIIDRRLENAGGVVDDLMAKWRQAGELDKEAIVDRRVELSGYAGPERRLSPAPVAS